MAKDLEELGSRLDIDDEDMERIRRKKRKELILGPVIGISITVLSTMLGYFIGKNDPVYDKVLTYPYAGPFIFAMTAGVRRKRFWISVAIITLIASIIGFIIAHETAQPHEYGLAIEYGVYNK